MSYAYETDGAAIYRRSFAIIRAEARLDRFDAGDEKVAVRIIHASGMVDVADDIVFTSGFSAAATAAAVEFWRERLAGSAGGVRHAPPPPFPPPQLFPKPPVAPPPARTP